MLSYPLLDQQVLVLQVFALSSGVRGERGELRTEEQDSSGSTQSEKDQQNGLGGQDLRCHGSHGGLQVPQQVEALVEEGELSVDEGEHLPTENKMADSVKASGLYAKLTSSRSLTI